MYIKSLSSLLKGIAAVPSVFDVTVHGLVSDSREVKSGDAFIALAGPDGRADQYVSEAVRRGAVAVLLETVTEPGPCHEQSGVLIVPVKGLRAQLGELAARYFDHPAERMQVVGVTGTNGKTSVTSYLSQLLAAAGLPCGLIGTLGYGLPGRLHAPTHTTPDVVKLNYHLARILEGGGRAAAMEVSSHALDQGRVDGVRIRGAVFTNLTRDHLDYHGTMEAYGAAKARLFQRDALQFAVINYDDPFGRQLHDQLVGQCDRVRYSMHEAQVELWLKDYQPEPSGFVATIDGLWGEWEIRAPLLGAFNVSNVLAALGAALSLGVPVDKAVAAVASLEAPPGRLESFVGVGDVQVVVDYAHTPDALRNALQAVRQHAIGKLTCVFGCGGDRDAGKRPEMAREAEALADRVVVTDDNPRTEDPAAITDAIVEGFADPDAALVIHDRAVAIRRAIADSEPGDVVLVAGKGHESYQEIAGQRIPYSDVEHVKRALGLTGGVA